MKDDATRYIRASNYELDYNELHSGAAVADVDNDGKLDCVLLSMCDCHYAEAFVQTNYSLKLATNEFGLGKLTGNRDAVFADIDNDGRLDFIVIQDGSLRLYRNQNRENNNFVELNLKHRGAARASEVRV